MLHRIAFFIWRVMWEFIPPAIAAYFLLTLKLPFLDLGTYTFVPLYVFLNYCWLQLLRIWNQQGQRRDLAQVRSDLGGLKATVDTIMSAIDDLRRKDVPETRPEIERLSTLAAQANTQIDAANTAFESATVDYYTYNTGHGVETIHKSWVPKVKTD